MKPIVKKVMKDILLSAIVSVLVFLFLCAITMFVLWTTTLPIFFYMGCRAISIIVFVALLVMIFVALKDGDYND